MAKGNAADRARKQTKAAKAIDDSLCEKCPPKGKQPIKYHGKEAIKEVEKIEGPLSNKEKRIVILEGYVDGIYLDTNNTPTSGVGQTGKYMNMSAKDSIAEHEDKTRKLIPSYNKLPEYLQAELLQAMYRGDLGDSPKFRKLFNQGKYKEAAAEFLDHKEYKNAKTKQHIKERIKAVSDAVLQYDKEMLQLSNIGTKISQKQLRHIKNRKEWIQRGKGSYMESKDDAQKVLDAMLSGDAKILGTTNQGIVVKYDGVTGFNNNPSAGFIDQATNVFIIKGTKAPSVVPTSPMWKPK